MEETLISLLTLLYCEASNSRNTDKVAELPATIMKLIAPKLELAFKLDKFKVKLPINPIHGVILNAQEYEKSLKTKEFWRQE